MKTFRLVCVLAVCTMLRDGAFAQAPRLANLSTRGQAGAGANALVAGFVIGPGPDKTVLIRAVGPSLSLFGITSGTLSDPFLTLFDANGNTITTNDNWSSADAASFTAAGAFPLPANSKDSALVVKLAAGNYTAQVTGANGGTGIAIVEVYEVDATSTKLINISTRAQVGTGNSVLTPGIVIAPGSGTRRLLLRAAGPSLAAFGVTGVLANPTLSLLSGNTVIAANDDWGTAASPASVAPADVATASLQAGAFSFPAGSQDAATLVELAPGSYTIQVSGVGGTSGVALVEVYDLTPATNNVVTVFASKPNADESGTNNGEFTFTRTGDTLLPLAVSYSVGGSAVNGFDYVVLPNTITFPAGASTVKLPVLPNPDLQTEGNDTVVVTVSPNSSYTVGAQNTATVGIADSPASLYVATLRPAAGATNSTASGTATILLAASGTLAGVNVSFSNLSSSEVTAHLVTGAGDDFVGALPSGQVSGTQWLFTPTGNYTSTDLLNALKSGAVSVRIDSANFPGGELRGVFIAGAGSQTFTPPAAAPAVSLTNVTATDAARFLTQATFGPKQSEIDALAGHSIDDWITAQLALPFTSHRAATLADQSTYGGSPSSTNFNAIYPPNRQTAWFKNVLTAPDQLKQRVAFALSELLVVSDVSLGNDSQTEPLAAYYDILGSGVAGNFRTLLENITLNPMMGNYLSMLRNSKADPTTGTTPDENYAREVMQLFTIGLNLLQPDGTLQLGADGLPIATYDQTTITETAKVLTGWSYFGTTNFRTGGSSVASMTNPMILFPTFHDDTAKHIVNNVTVPANEGGAADLKAELDTLFNHPNTGPFVAKALIQRLVTSNPSPAYVYRVAQKFANNGADVRGDMGAVVRAILEDYEARSPSVASDITFGKLKEPILRLTNLLRSFNAAAPDGRYSGFRVTVNEVPINGNTPEPADTSTIASNSTGTNVSNLQANLDQAPLRSPTVFNFFHPAYVQPGTLAAAGLVAPEFEITDDTFSIDVPNLLRTYVFASSVGTTVAAQATIALDLTTEQALVATPSALLDHLAAVLAGGNLPAATRTRITTALAGLPASTTPLERAQSAVLLVLTSPAAAVQK